MSTRKVYPHTWFGRLQRLLHNRLTDQRALRSALQPEALQQLRERVVTSERRHTGQIRICVEAGLPWSYIRRDATPRERAIAQFGKLRVWDTEHNNGVLIYLLLAEHAIEIVADRGIDHRINPQQWQALAQCMGAAFAQERFADGLTLALEEVSALLVKHFRATGNSAHRSNELPDAPVLLP